MIAGFGKHYDINFNRPELLRLALTHRSYLSVTGQGPRDSNERLEFLGDSVLGLVTSEFLYRSHPTEHEGQLTKTKSLLVSKAILSRRALAMGLGRFVLMSHSEVESGGRQRLSILADAFESVVGAIYLDQGFEAARQFIIRWLLSESREIAADKRHTNYKSHLQEFVQSTFRTHPVYRIRSEMGPDHSKQFNVEVLVGRKTLGMGRGRNKKEAEQAAARDALEKVDKRNRDQASERDVAPREASEPREPRAPREGRESREPRAGRETREERPPIAAPSAVTEPAAGSEAEAEDSSRRRRGRRGGRGRKRPEAPVEESSAPREDLAGPKGDRARARPARVQEPARDEASPAPPPRAGRPSRVRFDDDLEEVGRPEGPMDERHVDPYESIEEPAPWPAREERPAPSGARAVSPPAGSSRKPGPRPTGPNEDPETKGRAPGTEEREDAPRPAGGDDSRFGRRPGRSRRGR